LPASQAATSAFKKHATRCFPPRLTRAGPGNARRQIKPQHHAFITAGEVGRGVREHDLIDGKGKVVHFRAFDRRRTTRRGMATI
jgi:hypothetical protein